MSNGPAGDSTNSQVSTVPSPNNNAVRSTLAVAGGVIGGVVAISIIAFLIWWWRRQRLRRRRETFLTPLNMANPFNDEKSGGGGGVMTMNEKGGYVIDRGSIGPTPVTTRFKTALGVNFSKIKGHLRNKDSTTPSVNLNRGTSQFIDSASNASVHSRSNSSFDRADPTTKDRFVDWFSRVKANWRTTRTSQIDTLTPMGQPPPALPPTLSNMDDNQLDREAQRLRSQSRHYSSRRSASAHFLSGLGLSFNNINNKDEERSRTSATPAPLNPFADPVNPFADPTTIPPPPPRRSRGQSIATTMMLGRDSLASVVTRNKFRSDPFDLEIPSGYGGGNSNKLSMISSNAGTAGNSSVGGGRDSQVSMLSDIVGVKKPEGVRTRGRAESFTSSKYSSGISLGEDGWSDPGPDVGRLALNGGRRMSGGSGGGGVGKAM
ncbi:hypothetical protein QBC38DRAFT_362633 [Podospora fimiseda]|uniref:Uncharacterized protein n=1 Tax=Podospora fimiseda TaxID=252190 RepID=A0AAN7BRK1_9PEZI|nr:hypothetical protein QBC38DRAFT_362633 [Podospora fimiseda]